MPKVTGNSRYENSRKNLCIYSKLSDIHKHANFQKRKPLSKKLLKLLPPGNIRTHGRSSRASSHSSQPAVATSLWSRERNASMSKNTASGHDASLELKRIFIRNVSRQQPSEFSIFEVASLPCLLLCAVCTRYHFIRPSAPAEHRFAASR